MAEFGVNIDTVYQTVQALANKEQRGYITPQEFNLFANQAQLDIFEQYLYDLNAMRQQRPEEHEIGDSVKMIRNKLEPWTQMTTLGTNGLLPNNSRTGRIFSKSGGVLTRIPKEMAPEDYNRIVGSAWHKEGMAQAKELVTWSSEYGKTFLADSSGLAEGRVETVLRRPKLVYWGYVIINEKPIYDPSKSKSFELHSSEQPDIIIKVLELAGISIEDPQLTGIASQEEGQNTADERI